MSFWKRIASFFVPSPASLTVGWAAFVLLMLMCLLILVMTLSEPELDGGMFMVSMAAMLAAALLGAAALFDKRPGGRVLLWSVTVLLFLAASAGMIYASWRESQEAYEGIRMLLCCPCLPFLGGLVTAWLFFGWRAWQPFNNMLRAARLQRLIGMVQARGEVTVEALSRELAFGQEQVVQLVRELIETNELMAYYEPAYERVYSAAALNEKQHRLLAVVTVQGKARLDDLANDLRLTNEMVEQWIKTLAQRGRLHGFVDWQEGLLYGQEAGYLSDSPHCPHCGGDLAVAGKGVIQCQHCGVEVFR